MGISYKINLKRFIHEKVQTCTLYLIQDEGKGIEVCQLHIGKILCPGPMLSDGIRLRPLSSAYKMKPHHSLANSIAIT